MDSEEIGLSMPNNDFPLPRTDAKDPDAGPRVSNAGDSLKRRKHALDLFHLATAWQRANCGRHQT